jgi:hypothetical protein
MMLSLLYPQFAYELFSETDTGLLYPAIEHGGARNNDDECPTPQGTILYQRVPTLSSDIVIDDIGK